MAKRSSPQSRGRFSVDRPKAPACTVMLADDQPIVAEALSRLIAENDSCQVKLITSDAMQLLASAERSPPTLVVLDAAMAQSFRVARSLATRCPRTKVILLDEFRLEAHLQRAIDCGAAGYLTKCDAAADLISAIGKVVAGGLSFPDQMPQPPRDDERLSPSASRGSGAHGLSLLTRRELEVLAQLAEGRKVKEIAVALGISPNTVENHKAHVMRKLGLHKNVELARFAIRHGIVPEA